MAHTRLRYPRLLSSVSRLQSCPQGRDRNTASRLVDLFVNGNTSAAAVQRFGAPFPSPASLPPPPPQRQPQPPAGELWSLRKSLARRRRVDTRRVERAQSPPITTDHSLIVPVRAVEQTLVPSVAAFSNLTFVDRRLLSHITIFIQARSAPHLTAALRCRLLLRCCTVDRAAARSTYGARRQCSGSAAARS